MESSTAPGSDKSGGRKANAFTRYLPAIARVLMGLLFSLTGLNGFLDFLPKPETLPDFAVALQNTGYMLPLIAGTQLAAGVLLVLNRSVPLALALIAPVVVNIFAFHLFLDRAGFVMAIIVAALEIYLAWSYRRAFRPMLAMRNTPGGE